MNNQNKTRIFRIMFAINVLAAGVPGFMMVFFPRFAEKYVLWEGQDLGVMTILGSIWLAIGLVSILGVMKPHAFLGVFLIQFIYKSVWLLSYVMPAFLAGETLPPASIILIGIFLVLIIECALFIRVDDFNSPVLNEPYAQRGL